MISREVYANFLAGYNQAVFPVHVFFYAVGIAAAVFVFARPGKWADVAVKGVLALLWAWLGVFYMLVHYTRVNSAGYTWGVLFLLQAAFFAAEALLPREFRWDVKIFQVEMGGIEFRPYAHPYLGHLGAAVAGWAFVGYPVSALLLHNRWPQFALFGAATPVVIYTCGLLLFTFNSRPRWRFNFIPFLWSVVGGLGAAAQWKYYEDYGLFVAGLILLGAWFWASNKYKPAKK